MYVIVSGIFRPENEWTRQAHLESVTKSGNYTDGSIESDLPMQQLSELFNVNHFIVSQVNAHSALLASISFKVKGKLTEKRTCWFGWQENGQIDRNGSTSLWTRLAILYAGIAFGIYYCFHVHVMHFFLSFKSFSFNLFPLFFFHPLLSSSSILLFLLYCPLHLSSSVILFSSGYRVVLFCVWSLSGFSKILKGPE